VLRPSGGTEIAMAETTVGTVETIAIEMIDTGTMGIK
jgi:hypothetical protein